MTKTDDKHTLWYWLTEPAPSIRENEPRKNVRLLSWLLLGLALATLFHVIYTAVYADSSQLPAFVITLIIILIGYGLSRTRFYQAAAILALAFLVVPVFISVTGETDTSELAIRGYLVWLALPVIVSSLFFTVRGTAILAIVLLAGIALLPVLIPRLSLSSVVGAWAFVLTTSVLVIMALRHRNQLERDRQMQLRESEYRYRALFERTNDAVFILNLDGTLIATNHQASDLLGYTTGELIGMPMEQVVMLPEYPNSLNVLDALLAGEQIPLYERLFKHKDGHAVPVEINAALVLAPDGTPMHIQSIVRDISDRKQTERDMQQRLNELETVNAISQASATQLELGTLLELVAQRLLQTFDAQGIFFALYDPKTNLLHFPYWYCLGQRLEVTPKRAGLAAQIIQSRQPLLINEDYERRFAEQGGTRVVSALNRFPKAWLGVPMFAQNEIVGVIAVQNLERENAFSEADVRLLATIAANVGIAIQNAHLYEQAQLEIAERRQAEEALGRYAREMAALNRGMQDIVKLQDLDELLYQITENAIELLERHSGGIALYRSGRDVLEKVLNIGEDLEPPGSVLHIGEGLVGRVWETRQAQIVQNYQDWADRIPSRSHLSVSVIGAPIEWGDEFLGVIIIADSTRTPFSDRDAEMLTQFAAQSAIAIQNVRLYEQAQQEIVERKQAEAALRESRQMLRLVIDHIPQTVFWKDRNLVFLGCNKAFSDIAGLDDPEDIVGQTDLDMVWADQAAAYRQADLRVIRSGIAELNVEQMITLPDGRRAWEQISKVPLYDEQGIVWAILGIAQDITERKQTEASLAQRTMELRDLYQASLDINAQTDMPALLQKVADRAATLIDVQRTSLYLLQPDRTIELVTLHNLPAEYLGTRLRLGEGLAGRVAQEGEPMMIEDYRQWDGRSMTFDKLGARRVVSVPLKARSRVIGTLNVTDIEQTGHFDDNQIRLLSLFADQAAVAIENAQLFTAAQQEIGERKRVQQELETKNAELERFTYTVSHDLKSPLITISGFAGFLAHDVLAGDDKRIKTNIARINEAVSKMQQLLDELLDLSRIGRIMNEPDEISLSELAREAADMVAGRLAEQDITVEIAPDLPTITGDRPRLMEVFQNLIDNAAKYMGDQPRPHIEIDTRDDEGQPVVYVRDNGMGIAPQYHEKIFGLFEKLDPDSEGTGIGLAIVKRIVETHGGRIWVESEGLGLGSTFCFTLSGYSD
ncbi:MAG: GAF domain-containing protein [Anaerolineae bacterium]|nr:GAF domain-containing protein [Anaerolineae bacterium]